MRRHLILALGVTLSLGLASAAVAVGFPGGTFFDDDGNTHEGAIEAIAAEGITKGCNPAQNTNYCPDEAVTRGQMAAFLVRALGYADDGGGDLFIDDDGSTFESDIDRLGTAGVTKGCNPPTNDRFCPDDFVLRDQMASFLSRALELTAAVPPDRVDSTNGATVNMLEIAAAQGCDAIFLDSDGHTDVCSASTSVAAGQPFYVEHGWFREDWSSQSPAEQAAFASDSTRFDLSLNGFPLELFEEFFVENDEAHKVFRFQFYGNLSQTTHRLVGEWVADDTVELRVILDVDVTP
ncbi:MAG TPA: S-layer homology domain-containing protein [Acidimicrobiia bacterium]